MLKAIGMDETAAQLESDKAILIEEEFSPLKSKIEYINRVVGVVIGMMISLVLFRSFRFLKSRKKLFFAALLAWLSVVFTGWFGSIVVSTNLTPWTVSVHLGFAFLIVGLLVYLYHATSVQDFEILSAAPVWLARLCFALSVTQMIFGVQVREAMDQVAFAFADKREEWVANLGMEFIVHRSFSWIVLLLNGWLSFKLIRISGYTLLPTGLALMMFGSVATGVGMAYASVPAFLQPMHLLISVLSFGILLLILLRTRSSLLRLNHS